MNQKIKIGVLLFSFHHIIVGADFLSGHQERQRVREQRMAALDERPREIDQRMDAAIIGIHQEQERRERLGLPVNNQSNFQNVLGFWRNREAQVRDIRIQDHRPELRNERAIATLLARLRLVKKEEITEDWKCAICFDDEKESRVRATNCQRKDRDNNIMVSANHMFHEKPCLENALKVDSRCPLCRQNMVAQHNAH